MSTSPTQLMTYQGMQVILSDGGNWCPLRAHSKRVNQGKASYHARIAKKWLNRFGRKWVETQKRGECFVLGNHSIIVRREDWPELQRAIDEQGYRAA